MVNSLFVKLGCRGDSEETFGHRFKLPPVHLFTKHNGGFPLSLLMLNVKSRKAVNTNFLVFGLTRPGMEPRSTVLVAGSLSTRPLID